MVAKKASIAAPVAVAPSPAPVKEAAPAKAKATKTKEVKTETVVEKAVEVVPTVEEPSTDAENPLETVFTKLAAAAALVKELQTAMKVLQKSYDRMSKVVQKQEKKKANARSTPSGFAKPTKISDELCAFLNVPKGTEMSRTEVTRALNLHVKTHNLYDQSNKRIILPDAKMSKILNLAPGEQLSFFTLQKAIKHHFAPSTPKA